jgi:hypothetical protein
MDEPVQHRADALFTLPRMPRAARVLGEPPGWPEDLRSRGIELVDGRAEIAVATPDRLDEALAAAPVVAIDGARNARRLVRRAGRARLVLTLPIEGTPAWMVPIAHPGAGRFAMRRFGASATGIRAVRDALGTGLLSVGLLDRIVPTIALAGDDGGAPALLAAARDLGVQAERPWTLFVAPGSAIRRNAFFALDGGAKPRYVVKFARIPKLTVHFDREDRGLALAAAAGGAVAAAVPRHLGRVEAGGYHAAVQEAAQGVELNALMASSRPPSEKLEALERVVGWLERCARETVQPPEALAPELERLMAHGREHWGAAGLPDDLPARLGTAPAVFRHVEVGTDHVFLGDGRITLLDWEWAQPHGLPLADLTYFGARSLRMLDGQMDRDIADYLADLMAGRAPSSMHMHRWIRRLANANDLPAETVSPLLMMALLELAQRGAAERQRADAAAGVRHGASLGERALAAWLRDPALGPDWRGWQD